MVLVITWPIFTPPRAEKVYPHRLGDVQGGRAKAEIRRRFFSDRAIVETPGVIRAQAGANRATERRFTADSHARGAVWIVSR
jgi:hypothetical protein